MKISPIIHVATKSDKKKILAFYKKQRYSARFLGFDQSYFITKSDDIIACVIVSKINANNSQLFLHALVTDKQHTHQKLASRLLQHCADNYHSLICFADQSLTPLYANNNFTLVSSNDLCEELKHRFTIYQAKNKYLLPFAFRLNKDPLK
ncbi:GNAT family N-acetyltransferase [Thalassotalea piscium]